MTRTGFLVFAAIVLALVAAAVLVWSDAFRLSEVLQQPSRPASAPSAPVAVADPRVVKPMTDAASVGGFAATFSGREGRTWDLARGHRVERFSVSNGQTVFARLASSQPLDPNQVINGLFVQLPAEFAQTSAGKDIEVGIVARAALANPSKDLSILYATQQAGNSGWRSFALSPNFELHSFAFRVPNAPGGYNARPVIAVHGDSAGQGLGVEIVGVYAKLLSPGTSPTGIQFKADFTAGRSVDWIVPQGHSLTTIQDTQTGTLLGRLTSARGLQTQGVALGSQGASVLVPAEVAQRLNGRNVAVVIRAKLAQSAPSSKLWAILATQQGGNTGWLPITLGANLSSHTFMYQVPKKPKGYAGPFLIVLHAENAGTAQSADIDSVELSLKDIE